MSNYYVAVKVTPEQYKHFGVPEEVYIYVKQLESAIKTGNTKGLEELYPERFKS